jgi:AsmA protein
MPRLILIPLSIVLLLLAAAAILVPLLVDEETLLEMASEVLYEETGATLTVDGDIGLSLFPTLGVSLADAGLSMAGNSHSELRARSLEIGVQLIPLFFGNIQINTIRLDGMTARVELLEKQPGVDSAKLSDEQLDAFYAARRKAMNEAGDAAEAELVLAAPLALKVKHLIVTDSRLELVDPATPDSRVIELLRLETTGLNLDGKPMPLELKVRVPGEQVIDVALDGNIGVDQQTQVATLETINLVINGVAAQPVKLQTSGSVDIARQVADLQLALELGETKGSGSLRYANFESPQIDTSLQLNLLDPALFALAGPEAAAEASGDTPAANGDEPLPLDAIRLIDTRADLSIDRARFDAHTVRDMRVKLRAMDGVIQVTSLTGVLHGGKLDLQATFNGKHNTAKLNTTGSLTAMDIATALAAAEADPILTGTANLNWQLNSVGRSVNELIAALRGPVKLRTDQVVVKDMSVEQMVCQAVALTNQEQLTATFPPSTKFQALSADIQLLDGKAILRPLRAELPQIALRGTGAFELLSQDFKASFKATLSPELEQLDRACRVSKRLTAIDWPVNCKGRVGTDPARWCSVDTEEIIQDLAKNEGKRKLQKEANKLLKKLFN